MPGEHLPDPPIPDAPAWSPAPARRGSYARRVLPGSTGYVPGGPVTTTIATGLAEGDLVKVARRRPTSRHADAAGTIYKFRPALSTGIRPVSIILTKDCVCCTKVAGDELLVPEDDLELLRRSAHMPAATAKAPAKATLPSLRRGDRVLITRFARPTFGTVVTAEADPVRYYVAVDDGSEEWFSSRDLEPAPTAILDEPSWTDGPDPEPPPPPPGVSTEYPEPKPRYLFVAIPLTDDPADDPTDATELIDLIAERHEHIRFEAHDLETPDA